MYGNGATTGTTVLTEFSAAAVCIATAITAWLLIGATTTRTTASKPWASALFAPRSNPIWVQKEGVSHASEAAVARAAWL